MRPSRIVFCLSALLAMACGPRDSTSRSTPVSTANTSTSLLRSLCLDSLNTTRDTLVFSNISVGSETGDVGGTEFYFTRTPSGAITGAHRHAEGALDSTYYPLAGIRLDRTSGTLAFDVELRGWTPKFEGSFTCDSLTGVLSNWGKSVWHRMGTSAPALDSLQHPYPFDSALASGLNDWLIVPGIRVGPVTAYSTEAELKTTFGADQIIRDSVFWLEGEYRPATIIFPQDSARRLSIVWRDEETWSRPERIEFDGGHSRWHTPDGITLGTTVAALERLNGGPFRITSVHYDYAGLAWSWENGALDPELKYLELWLEPRFSGEQHTLSSDRIVRSTRPAVARMYAYFHR